MKKSLFFFLLLVSSMASASAQRQLHYIALELDSLSRDCVAAYARQHLPWADAEVIAHHMTLLHYTGLRCLPDDPEVATKDYVLNWALQHVGETFTLTATEVGQSERAFALRITDVDAPSLNRIKHITLATNPAGGSAVDSNYITEWTPLAEPFILTGRVTIYYK